jgi:uncharacterized alkaline shock family protein YloU
MSKEEKKVIKKITHKPGLGDIKIADDVVAKIATLAANEVEGVAYSGNYMKKEISDKLGMKNLSKGVKVDVLEGVVTVSIVLTLKYNYNVMAISKKVQIKIKDAIENMTGLEVADVNIKIAGVMM